MKVEVFLAFLFLFSLNFLSQNQNLSNGYFVIKTNASCFIDYDQQRYDHGNPNYKSLGSGSRGFQEPFLIYTQLKPLRSYFPGGEINYYLSRDNFFGINVGLAFSYDQTFYSVSSTKKIYTGSSESYQRINANGKGCLLNKMFKFVYGFNFNSKGGFNFCIQPINPEFRFIKTGNSFITNETLEVLLSKKVNSYGARLDSTSTVISSERTDIQFMNYKTRSNVSISFPTLFGIEQKFKMKKINYVAGLSASFSFLETYAVFRVYFGICFGNFKESSQPGY
ncbi:MAG: hypothetical protein H0U95_00355 [Bacteroidetes bacterium]|nr:hypothetical protein [Bacteroidota bacterium]